MTRAVVNNFKEVVKPKVPKPKPNPNEDWWRKFDEILHQILF